MSRNNPVQWKNLLKIAIKVIKKGYIGYNDKVYILKEDFYDTNTPY